MIIKRFRSLADIVTDIVAHTRPTRILISEDNIDLLKQGIWPNGDDALPGPPGPPGDIVWLGPWQSGILYLEDDAVEHNGSSYIATAANINSAPPNSNWNLLAAQGNTGATGAAGATGAQGIPGTPGAPGDTGPQGPQGNAGPNSISGSTTTTLTGLLKGTGTVVAVATAPADFVATADSRLSDARTPVAHKTSHQDGGADELSVTGLSGLLGDAQTPLAHKTSHQNGGADQISVAGLTGLLGTAQTPAAHTHPESDVTNLVTDLAAKQPLDADLTTIAGLTATTDNFLQSVASAWASRTPAQAKATLALVKGDVGLSSVDNTSDANKPVSTATQTALNLKQDTLVSGTNIKTINSTSVLGSGNLVVSGAQPDITQDLLAPAVDETITAGYSAVLVRKYTIASGKKLTIGSAARFRVL